MGLIWQSSQPLSLADNILGIRYAKISMLTPNSTDGKIPVLKYTDSGAHCPKLRGHDL